VRLRRSGRVLVALALLAVAMPVATAATLPAGPGAPSPGTGQGFVQFPRDEHQHVDGWDYWWGAANVVAESGNQYTVGMAYTSYNGYGASGYQLFPRQGPYAGQSIMTMDGPAEWGHPGEPAGRYVRKMSAYVPGVSDLLQIDTLDTSEGMKVVDRWERTSLDSPSYRLSIDQDRAKVHPTGAAVQFGADLHADMKSPPLLAGGTGQWWYGIPTTFGYPSRSFQYMQATQHLTGTLDLQQPDGSILHETVAPAQSTMLMVHEYDATPEDIPAGLAAAEGTQVHPRHPQYYNDAWPWELLFVDLDNGAQLMVAVLGFHDTPNGTATPYIAPSMPTYRLMATLRLPGGESVPLDDTIHVEHLAYRHLDSIASATGMALSSLWTQAWKYRISYAGGTASAPGGAPVQVPAFDLGVVPQFGENEPAPDAHGNRLLQRVPFLASGSYSDCPVHGFAWSELLLNWYGHEDKDPWFSGGPLPAVPAGCQTPGAPPPSGTTGNLNPPRTTPAPPNISPEGCSAYGSGASARCEYDAKAAGGLGGYGGHPGGWTVTVTRTGQPDPITIASYGDYQTYPCGTIRPGDHVVATAQPDSNIFAGNPGICY